MNECKHRLYIGKPGKFSPWNDNYDLLEIIKYIKSYDIFYTYITEILNLIL